MISEEQILKKLLPHLKDAKANSMFGDSLGLDEFTLEDLVGKTTSRIMKIDNPLPYNVGMESPNPKKFKVVVYSDDSYLLHMDVGWHDGSTLHSFLVEEDKVRYSRWLYGDLDS